MARRSSVTEPVEQTEKELSLPPEVAVPRAHGDFVDGVAVNLPERAEEVAAPASESSSDEVSHA